MRIKFKVGKKSVFPSDELKKKWSITFGEDKLCLLNQDQTFTVYSMIIDGQEADYFLMDGYSSFNSKLFEIIDNRLSRYWRFSEHKKDSSWVGQYALAYPEFIEDKKHLLGLVDGKESDNELFWRYRRLMDLEFRDPNVTKKAQILDGNWVMCPDCCESWDEESFHEMTCCPKCRTLLLYRS